MSRLVTEMRFPPCFHLCAPVLCEASSLQQPIVTAGWGGDLGSGFDICQYYWVKCLSSSQDEAVWGSVDHFLYVWQCFQWKTKQCYFGYVIHSSYLNLPVINSHIIIISNRHRFYNKWFSFILIWCPVWYVVHWSNHFLEDFCTILSCVAEKRTREQALLWNRRGFIELNEERLEINRTMREHKWEDWQPGWTQAKGRFNINDWTRADETHTRTNKG